VVWEAVWVAQVITEEAAQVITAEAAQVLDPVHTVSEELALIIRKNLDVHK
jgi:hypothetical protein